MAEIAVRNRNRQPQPAAAWVLAAKLRAAPRDMAIAPPPPIMNRLNAWPKGPRNIPAPAAAPARIRPTPSDQTSKPFIAAGPGRRTGALAAAIQPPRKKAPMAIRPEIQSLFGPAETTPLGPMLSVRAVTQYRNVSTIRNAPRPVRKPAQIGPQYTFSGITAATGACVRSEERRVG